MFVVHNNVFLENIHPDGDPPCGRLFGLESLGGL